MADSGTLYPVLLVLVQHFSCPLAAMLYSVGFLHVLTVRLQQRCTLLCGEVQLFLHADM